MFGIDRGFFDFVLGIRPIDNAVGIGAVGVAGAATLGDGAVADVAASGAFDGMFGGVARAGFSGESIFGVFGRIFGTATDVAWDYIIWRDLFGNNGSRRDFDSAKKNMSPETLAEITHLGKVVKGHKVFKDALEAAARHDHENKDLSALCRTYKSLGMTLPDDVLRQKSFNVLSKAFHPDKNREGERIMQEILDANSALKAEAENGIYARFIKGKSEKQIDELIKKMGGIGREEARESQTALSSGEAKVVKEIKGAGKWFAELKPGHKTGLMFATVAGVALGTVAIASIVDGQNKKTLKRTLALEYENTEQPHQQRLQKDEQPLAVNTR